MRFKLQTIDKEKYFMSTDTHYLDLESGRIDIEIGSLDREFVYFLQSDIRGKDETLYRDRRNSFMSKNVSLVKTLEIDPVFFYRKSTRMR